MSEAAKLSVVTDPCNDCRGRGQVQDRSKLDVTIPAGVDNGMRVRLAGYGEPSPDGGPPGDCYCFVEVKKHKLFEREGTHLVLRMPISYSQAALGATIEVPTLAGPHELRIEVKAFAGKSFLQVVGGQAILVGQQTGASRQQHLLQ